jgi:hypothetical protein
MIQRK